MLNLVSPSFGGFGRRRRVSRQFRNRAAIAAQPAEMGAVFGPPLCVQSLGLHILSEAHKELACSTEASAHDSIFVYHTNARA